MTSNDAETISCASPEANPKLLVFDTLLGCERIPVHTGLPVHLSPQVFYVDARDKHRHTFLPSRPVDNDADVIDKDAFVSPTLLRSRSHHRPTVRL